MALPRYQKYAHIMSSVVLSSTGRPAVVATTVQPKAVMFPTDAKLLNRTRERLVRLANKFSVELRQSYRRVGKLVLIKHERYAHAHQFKSANGAYGSSRPALIG